MSISRGHALAQENQILSTNRDRFVKVDPSQKVVSQRKKSFLHRFNLNATLMRVLTMGFSEQRIYLQQLFLANQKRNQETSLKQLSVLSEAETASYRPESHGFTNRYNQLPCDLLTRKKRINWILELVKKNAEILLLGDDDLVSVELARENFSRVHVADCDRALLETIHHFSEGFSHQPTLHEADFTRHDPKIPACSLVLLDPANHVDSVLDFGRVAIKNQSSLEQGFLMIMINPILIGDKGVGIFLSAMKAAHYELVKCEPEFNFYPVNLIQKLTMRIFWYIHLKKTINFPLQDPHFFTSDCYLFQKINKK